MTPWSYPSKKMLMREKVWIAILSLVGESLFHAVVNPMMNVKASQHEWRRDVYDY